MTINELTISEHIEYVFTDFFDTIVSRKCHPEEIKRKWCKRTIEYLGLNISTEVLAKLRVDIEAELCSVTMEVTGEQEFRYSDLLERLIRLLGVHETRINETKCFLYNLELEIEIKYQFLNADVITFLKKQEKLGKKIIIISDFYGPTTFLEDLIKHHNIKWLFSDIFVSSDLLLTKRNGTLYKHVLNCLSVDANKVFMIGDNYHSDIESAKINNISSFHVKRNFDFYKRSIFDDKNIKQIKSEYYKVLDQEEQSFSWMAVPIYIFIVGLYKKLKQNNASNVVFLAREGEFLKELFDIYLANINDNTIKTCYMYASRRGTYLPSLFELNSNTFNKITHQYPESSIQSLLDSLSLTEHIDYLKSELQYIDFDKQHFNIKSSEDFKRLMSSKCFRYIFLKESQERRLYLNDYLNNLIGKNENIHLVDVGWKGSIQDNIHLATGRKAYGYYCGLLPNAYTSENCIKSGILFEYLNGKCIGYPEYNEFRASFEVFCAASHGSLIKYKASPDFGELENNKYELELYTNNIRPIQKNLITIIENLFNLNWRYSISNKEINDTITSYYFKRMMLPTNNELLEFSQYKHYENFGTFDFSIFNAKRYTRIQYLKQLIKNPRLTIGKEWWKPLAFNIQGLPFLIYPYYMIKCFKKRFIA